MISKEEVKHIAKLARIGLSDAEIKKFQKELSSIIDYISKLKKVDVKGVDSSFHPSRTQNVAREDKSKEKKEEEGERLIKAAPWRKGRYIKTKRIL